MRATPFPKVPKVREQVCLRLTDGTSMDGFMFIEATSRVQDVLNGANRFFPFVRGNESGDEELLLINKDSVTRVSLLTR